MVPRCVVALECRGIGWLGVGGGLSWDDCERLARHEFPMKPVRFVWFGLAVDSKGWRKSMVAWLYKLGGRSRWCQVAPHSFFIFFI